VASPLLSGQRPTAVEITQGVVQTLLFGSPRFGRAPAIAARPDGTTAPKTVAPDISKVNLTGVEPKAIVVPTEGGYHQVHDKDGNVVLETQNPAEAQARADELNKPKGFQLPPEESAMIDAERANVPHQIELVDPETMPEGQPFAAMKNMLKEAIAIGDKAHQRILVNARNFHAELQRLRDNGVKPEQMRDYVRSLLVGEEYSHLHTSDKEAEDFWNNMSPAEQAIHKRSYIGPKKGAHVQGTENWTAIDWGNEASAYVLTKLRNMTPRQIVETTGRERWTLQSLSAAESIIRNLRQFATQSGGRNRQIALNILDRMQANLNIAKAVVASSTPAASRKEDYKHQDYSPEDLERYKELNAKMKPTSAEQFASPEYQEVWRQFEALRNKYGGMPPRQLQKAEPPSDAAQEHIASLEAAAKQYEASGDPESAAEIRNSAKWFAQRTGEKSLPAARNKFTVRPLSDEEKAMLPPVKPEDRTVVLPPKPQGELPLEGVKGRGAIKPPAGTRGEYRKQSEDMKTPPLILSEYFKPSGGVSKPVPATERVGASESGALPSLAGGRVDKSYPDEHGKYPNTLAGKAGQWLDTELAKVGEPSGKGGRTGLPKIKDLETVLKRATGGRLQEGASFDMAQRMISDRLQKSTGEQLTKMYQQEVDRRHRKGGSVSTRAVLPVADSDAMEVFRRNDADNLMRTPIPYPADLQKFLHESTQDRSLVKARLARRQKVIGYLFDRMTRRPLSDIRTQLERSSIKPEDIRYGTEWRYPGAEHTAAWQAFGPEDEKTPQVLGHKLVDEASVSGDLPKTVTRRVTALINRATGRVSLVSTYAERGRDETRLLDPDSGAARRHSALPTILKRYRVLYSGLLDQPVQNFRQDYASLPDFMEKFGSEAAERDAATRKYQEPPPIEGTPGLHGEGGELVEEFGEGAIEKAERTPMTPQEAMALNGQVSGAENVGQAVEALKGLRTKPNHSAISALVKMSGKLQADNPDMDAQGLLRLAATRILQARERSKTPAEFVKNLSAESSSMPQARMKFAPVQQKVEDVSSRVGEGLRSAYVKSGRNEAVVASLDAADDGAVNARIQAAEAVRMRSIDGKTGKSNPQILSAANAFLATGAIKADYKMNLAQQHGAERLKAQSKAYQEGRRLMQSPNPQDQANGLKMAAEAMRRDVHKVMLEEGIISHEGAEYSFDESAKDRLDEFIARVNNGIQKADELVKSGGWNGRREGRAWRKAGEPLKSELEFAKAQWNNPLLRDTALQMRKEFDNQFDFEVAKGFSLRYDENYNSGRYDGEYYTDNGVWFHGRRVLGGQWRAPKMFQTYYHAIEQGPFIPLSRDGSVIVGNRVGQGMRKIGRADWLQGLEDYKSPVSGMPMVVQPRWDEATRQYLPPSADYELVKVFGRQKPVAVLAGADARFIENITAPSWFDRNTGAANALAVSQYLKHSVLMGDFFHLARVSYYAAAISGRQARMMPGWAALHIRESEIPVAVRKGVISQKTADYLNEKLPFNNNGRPQVVSRIRLARMFSQAGFNVNRIGDALYKDLVRSIPLIGTYNKFLFDRFTPGLMMDSAIREFQRVSAASPDEDSAVVMRKISKDLNYFFGSIGRQGWIKSATAQDAARMVALAPQWLEGLVKKEVSPARWLISGGREHGTSARAMARGLAAMFVLTQVSNLITRGKPTWDNEEKDHKWDADFGGVWVSPLSVFNELTHDILRLSETKPKVWDAVKQVGENKLGFYGRVAVVLATDRSPSGEYITTTPGVIKSAAEQLLPVPISFGKAIHAGASFVTQGRVPPLEPGQLQRQVMATLGIKGQVASQSVDSIQHQATLFAQQDGFQPDSIELQATDQPSYSKLRHAIFIGDQRGAQAMMAQLLRTHTPEQITRAMSIWSRRPFTGSRKAERLFVDSLDDGGRNLYTKAQHQRMDIFNQYVSLVDANQLANRVY
jgi:hypothetical protein